MEKAMVFEPSRVVEQAIQSASETAVMILRIDDVISSRSTGPMEGGEFDGMGM
jgi:chaperonin GroEL (HSP60 family)